MNRKKSNFQSTKGIIGRRHLFLVPLLLSSKRLLATLASTAGSSNNSGIKRSSTSTVSNSNSNKMIGGGAINEKERTFQKSNPSSNNNSNNNESKPSPSLLFGFQPSSKKSHLWHALEGLDRYPRYLSRWSLEDTESLEQALQEQLEKVRQQKQLVQEQRASIQKLVDKLLAQDDSWKELLQPPQTWEDIQSTILDSRVCKAIFRSKMFRKGSQTPMPVSVHDVLSGKSMVELDVGYLQELMDQEFFDVYSFPLLQPSFCEKLKRYTQTAMDLLQTPEFAHLNHGVRDFDNFGLKWLNDLLFHLVLRPITRHLFMETETQGGDLDWRQGYIAAYSSSPDSNKPRQRLVSHTDDSEVTMNICLGNVDFIGGELIFRDLRGNAPNAGRPDAYIGTYTLEIGRALIHAGRHFHEVTPIESGDRYAYIMWARSWNGIRAESCPCCWLNGRRDRNCICGPRWN